MEGRKRELFIEGKGNEALVKEHSKKHITQAIKNLEECDGFILISTKKEEGSTLMQVSTLSDVVYFMEAARKVRGALGDAGLKIIKSSIKDNMS